METVRLYYENAFTQDFTAVVESCGAVKGGFAVVLDRTAFYPEGGGQPADHGTLGNARVLDVHEKDGIVTHLCDRALPVGAEVSGHIDWARRFDHMQQHSGEQDVSAESNFFRRQLHCFQRKNEAVESGAVAQQCRVCGEGTLHVVRQQTSLLFGQTRLTVSPKRQQGGKERMAFRLFLFDVISLYHSLFVCGFLLFQPMVNQFSGENDLSGDGG